MVSLARFHPESKASGRFDFLYPKAEFQPIGLTLLEDHEMSDDSEISLMAHLIWQCEGCPVGRELRHWQNASKLLEAAAMAPDRPAAAAVRDNFPAARDQRQRRS